MEKTLLTIFCFASGFMFSQTSEILRGKIIADTTQIESVNIFNRSKGIGTINDKAGFFEIAAEVGDTLLFSSVRHQQKVVVVNRKALQSASTKIKLEVKVNELDEVRISQYNLSGEAAEDAKTIKTYEDELPIFSAKQLDETPFVNEQGVSTTRNTTVDHRKNATRFDFIALGRMIGSLFKKKGKTKDAFVPKISSFYNEDFFINQLDLPKDKVYDFLDFVNDKKGTTQVLTSGNDLEVIEYLLEQSRLFKENEK